MAQSLRGYGLKRVLPAGEIPPQQEAIMNSAANKILTGMRAMLVEDQSLIALDTEALLRELGAAGVDSFVTAQDALEWLASADPDIGVLDINLGGDTSYRVAAEMLRRAKPFIFTTGYSSDGLTVPPQYADVQIVRKPYTREALADALVACFGAGLRGH
jgi:CheY-like chemotaxis protein